MGLLNGGSNNTGFEVFKGGELQGSYEFEKDKSGSYAFSILKEYLYSRPYKV